MSECYFCGSNADIEQHHIVPQRFDGTDHKSNLVDLCHDCHWKLERMYNKEFWDAIGIEDPRTTKESHITCYYQGCTDPAVDRYNTGGGWTYRCSDHTPGEEESPDFAYGSDETKSDLSSDMKMALNDLLGGPPSSITEIENEFGRFDGIEDYEIETLNKTPYRITVITDKYKHVATIDRENSKWEIKNKRIG